MSLDLPPSHTSPTSSHVCKRCSSHRTACSSQTSSVCLSCGYELEICSGSEMEEGESKLFKLLFEANNNTTERELWSCFVIRRSLYVVKVLSKPCVITIQQFLVMLKIFLELLAKIGKTGNKHIDNLLSVITMMIHTYRNKHQVQQWTRRPPSRFDASEVSTEANGWTSLVSLSECTQASCTSASTVSTSEHIAERNERALAIYSDDSKDVGDFLSNDFMRCQLQECLEECLAGSFVCLENHHDDTGSYIEEEPVSIGESSEHVEDLGRSYVEGIVVNNSDQ